MTLISNYVESRKTGLIKRLAAYVDMLRATPMSQSDIAHHGYEYALAILHEAASYWKQAGQDVSFTDQIEVREHAAQLLAQVMSRKEQRRYGK